MMLNFKKNVKTQLSFAATLLLLTGCSLMPKYERPAAPIDTQWPEHGLNITTAEETNEIPSWQQFVGDAQLRELIELALQNNRDLRLASLVIEKARAQYQLAGAGALPTLGLGLQGDRKNINNGSQLTSTYNAGVAVSNWEIDFWGRLRSITEASRSSVLSSAYAREAVQTSLIANLATAWLNLQSIQAQIELTDLTLKARQDSELLMQRSFESGVASGLELSQAKSLTATARSSLAEQRRQLAQARNAVILLVGQPVEAQQLTAGSAQELIDAFHDVPAGLPSQLLLRRADIQAQEWQLRATNANIGSARAAFFPNISLTANIGTSSSQLSSLFKSGNFIWSLATNALLPIFDGGRNEANLKIAKIERESAVANYEKVIQTAFTEVADALAARATFAEQLAAQEDFVGAEKQRFELSKMRYENGISSFSEVLDAQRSLFSAQQTVLQTRTQLLANRIQTFRVLGGGWDAELMTAPVGEQN